MSVITDPYMVYHDLRIPSTYAQFIVISLKKITSNNKQEKKTNNYGADLGTFKGYGFFFHSVSIND